MVSRRQLAAIMFTDIVGYTAMMQQSEQKAISSVKRHEEILEACTHYHGGDVLQYYGDGSLSVFKSAVDALNCAMKMQEHLRESPVVPLRIGIHIGEVLFEEGKVFGDGVNIASRIESLGQAGTVLFSRHVHEKIRNLPEFHSTSLGEFELKNVEEPLEVFALANEGIVVPKRSQVGGKLKASTTIRRKSYLPIVFATILVGVLAASFFMYKRIANQEIMASSEAISIAVLPFENLSGDPGFEYFADGMSQELCNRLAGLENLEILARRACLKYKGLDMSPMAIAQELRVNYLIEGSVRKSADEIRINSQLIDGNTGMQLAAYPFTGMLEDVLDAQDQAALKIANELNLQLNSTDSSAITKRYTDDAQAYDLFIKAWMLYESCHSDIHPPIEKLKGAKDYFEQALERDSTFAVAYAGLSATESALIYFGVEGAYDSRERARSLAEKALELDPDLSEGYFALGELAHTVGQHAAAMELYKTSLNGNQENPIAWCHLSYSARSEGQLEEALHAAKMATHQQPTYIWSHLVLGTALRVQKRYEEAISAYEFAATLEPSWRVPYTNLGVIYLLLGEYEQALSEFQYAAKIDSQHIPTQVNLAYCYGGLGDIEKSLSYLDRAFAAGESRFLMIEFSPHLRNLRNDEHFLNLIAHYRGMANNSQEEMGLLGTAVNRGGEEAIPMQLVDRRNGIWETEITLKKGELRYVVNNKWNQNWGGSNFPVGKAEIYGNNIKVEEGHYHVVLDLRNEKYEFSKLP